MACQYKRIEAAITKCTIRRVRRVLCIAGVFWCIDHFRGKSAPFCIETSQISRLATIVLTFAKKNWGPHKQKAPARFASNRGLRLSECSYDSPGPLAQLRRRSDETCQNPSGFECRTNLARLSAARRMRTRMESRTRQRRVVLPFLLERR